MLFTRTVSPSALNTEDLISFFMWKRFPLNKPSALQDMDSFLTMAEAAKRNGDVWNQRELVKMAVEWYELGTFFEEYNDDAWKAMGQKSRQMLDDIDFQLLKQGTTEIKPGVRPVAATRQDAEKMAREALRTGNYGASLSIIQGYVCLAAGQYQTALDFFTNNFVALMQNSVQTDLFSFIMLLTEALVAKHCAIFHLREGPRWHIFRAIYANEGEFWRGNDDMFGKALRDTCLRMQRHSLANQVRLVKDAIFMLLKGGHVNAAKAYCKRFVSLQKAALTVEINWPNLVATTATTEALLKEFDMVARFYPAEPNSVRVSMSVSSTPAPASDPRAYMALLTEFEQSSMPLPDPVIDMKQSAILPITNYATESSSRTLFTCCRHCGSLVFAEPKLVPSAGYKAGIACSIGLIPFGIGIVSLVSLMAAKPCHYVQYHCMKCTRKILDE